MAAGVATSLAGLILQEGERGALIDFSLVGFLACTATLASVYIAGRLRKDPGGDLGPIALPSPPQMPANRTRRTMRTHVSN